MREEKKKSLAEIMYEQEEKDIERAINTLNRFAANKNNTQQNCEEKAQGKVENKIDQKAIILDYLEKAYSGAKMMDDAGLMLRLSRAILAFSYDDLEKKPTWDEMLESYMEK